MSDMGSSDGGKSAGEIAKDEAALAERMRTLGSKLDKIDVEAKRAARVETDRSSGSQGMGLALRVASEFAAGILVGAGLGWLIDHWLGTTPWGMIVLLLLGFVAGILNVLRAVGKVAQPEERLKAANEKNAGDRLK
jgi:ATP synthase protein I